jgi:hypothetical protein
LGQQTWKKDTKITTNYTKCTLIIPNVYTLHQMYINYTKWLWNSPNAHKLSIVRLFKNYPKMDFWFENIPSGNPVSHLLNENVKSFLDLREWINLC